MGFVNIYGPRVPRAGRYGGHGIFTFAAQSLTVRLLGWSGAVGTTMRFFSEIALFFLPFVVYFVAIPDRC